MKIRSGIWLISCFVRVSRVASYGSLLDEEFVIVRARWIQGHDDKGVAVHKENGDSFERCMFRIYRDNILDQVL